MRKSLLVPTSALAVALLTAAMSPAVAAPGHGEGLPNVDTRTQRAPVDAGTRAARGALERELGPLGEVTTDPASGGVEYVGRSDGLLSGRSGDPDGEIVRDYLREHDEVFRLSEADLATLRLVARSVSPDGIVHLRFNQVLDGILAFDSGVDAHLTDDGRLITVSGAPVPGARLSAAESQPTLSARAGLRQARAAIEGDATLPAVERAASGPAQTTTFTSGERALLRWSATADGAQLAWSVLADDADGRLYDVLLDADDGDLLRRQDLTSHLGQAKYFRVDPEQTPVATQLTMSPAWYDEHAGGTRLWGQFARTYVDPDDQDPAPGSEAGGTRAQIPASGGGPGAPDWLYTPSTSFPGATPCVATGCTWAAPDRATAVTNQAQVGANVHVLTSRFHDHLLQAPIGFDEASGNFQRENASGQGQGGDYVRAEINDGQGFNNANFGTPPDGAAPRMQMYLFNLRNNNGGDVADIVYHEYGHGLSARLVVNASGGSTLASLQGAMMGEAWSDFYALDLLVSEGSLNDTAASGELKIGTYVLGPGGVRDKATDCPVDPTGPTPDCNGNGKPAVVLGGYTYGDIAVTDNTTPHNGGEVWAQTLWDIRRQLGRQAALALVTGGMRLSPDDPSMLDMRDAILLQAVATRSAAGAADDYYARLWEIFRTRGMGGNASTPSAKSETPTEGFASPTGVRAGRARVRDPYPGGDNDGLIEAGEEFQVRQPVTGVGLADLSGVAGVLTLGAPATVIDPSAAWPLLGQGRMASNSDPLTGRLPAGQCTATSNATIDITSSEGGAQSVAVIDPRPASIATVSIPDNETVEATFRVQGGGTISDVDLRIDELRHTYLGDLKIELLHDGVSAQILSNPGSGGYTGDDILDAIFDSDSAAAIALPEGGPITGRARPQVAAALDVFDGHPAAGEWTLRLTDVEAPDSGQLRRWGLSSPQVGCTRSEIPAADTQGAFVAGPGAATVEGSVTPNGRATGLRFAYGPTPSYGEATAVQEVGDGDAAVAASAVLGGLQAGTTYHYRVESIREAGQLAVAGADRTFTTAPAPASITRDATAPVLSGARITLAKVSKKSTRKRATVHVTLSEPASLSVVLTRPAAGIKKGKSCVAVPKRRPKKAKSCERLLPSASTTATVAAAGATSVTFPPAGLKRGKYRATLTATDGAGNQSQPVVSRFTVK